MEPVGTSISVSACKELSQWGGLSSCRESRLLPEDAGIPERDRKKIKLLFDLKLIYELFYFKMNVPGS